MSAPEVGAVVVGAGIAGLAAALTLQETRGEVFVIDASDRPGGVMRTDHVSRYVVERGPNTIHVKAPMLGALRELGFESALRRAEPESRRRFLYREGALVPVPMSLLAFARTPLLSVGGKLRLLAEPLIRRGDPSDESVAEFAGRRLGRQVVTNLVGPFLTGIYAGDEDRLGADAVFGTLTALERSHRSLAIGLVGSALHRRAERGLPGSYSTAEGLGPFARHLAERLREPPALDSHVREIRREGGRWRVSVSGPGGERILAARCVVVATPAHEATRLLRGASGEVADALAGIAYAPIVSVPLGVESASAREPIEGFGFLVPRDAGLTLLGCLFMSRLFPGRAPEGHELLQCLVGGVRWPDAIDAPDDVILDHLYDDLERSLGLAGEAQSLGLARWPRAIPQPGRDHVRRIRGIREQLASPPGLALAGGYLDGVSVSDTFASGIRAAVEVTAPG